MDAGAGSDRRPGRVAGGCLGGCWGAFRRSPYFAASVMAVLIAAMAGLFAGSYTYAFANPTPRRISTAVTGVPESQVKRAQFVAGMEKALGASLVLHHYDTFAQAKTAIEEQQAFAILREPGEGRAAPRLYVSSASGASVAQVFTTSAPRVGASIGVPIAVTDIHPLQKGDPRGLTIFYVSLAAVILGFVGAMQLTAHAGSLRPVEHVAFIAVYAMLGAFAIASIVDWGLGAIRLPFAESWAILALTMFTSGMVSTMFTTLIGRWAILPTWGLLVVIGNPSSGGAVSWPLLPSLFGLIGRWLPPGASVNAQHTAVYFGDHQHAYPFLVLAAWALGATAVFWVRTHPGILRRRNAETT
ncbi:ABC transporter permease [Streptomyces sp. TP-A0356]|uniref:ABC transporter permease n=1 Tax=Streptomyces sp. TP-A0356 TaxID=1359208 RepID=UPI000AD74049|nr:ABC transporter permease [Streptomyces sp. TP-A0356]